MGVPSRGLLIPTVIALALLLVSLVTAAPVTPDRAAAEPVAVDTTASPPVRVSVLPVIGAFFSPTRGFGVGAEATVEHLGWTDARLVVTAEAMQRYGHYRVRYLTGDPFTTRLVGSASVAYTGSSVYAYYGLGPRSQLDDQIESAYRRIEGEVRVGWYPREDARLLVQPVARVIYDHVRRIEDKREGAFDRLDAPSQDLLLRAVGTPSTSVTYGVESVFDALDRPELPRFGSLAQASVRRLEGIDGPRFGAWAGSASAYGYLPIGPGVIETRALMAWTRETSAEPVPFTLLPSLDNELLGGYARNRLRGRDALVLSAGYRMPIPLPIIGLFGFGAEGAVAVHAVNSYDDLFRQFEPGLAFEPLDREGTRAPLRPALSVGGYLVQLASDSVLLTGQAAISPEGLELVTLRFLFDFRDRRTVLR